MPGRTDVILPLREEEGDAMDRSEARCRAQGKEFNTAIYHTLVHLNTQRTTFNLCALMVVSEKSCVPFAESSYQRRKGDDCEISCRAVAASRCRHNRPSIFLTGDQTIA